MTNHFTIRSVVRITCIAILLIVFANPVLASPAATNFTKHCTGARAARFPIFFSVHFGTAQKAKKLSLQTLFLRSVTQLQYFRGGRIRLYESCIILCHFCATKYFPLVLVTSHHNLATRLHRNPRRPVFRTRGTTNLRCSWWREHACLATVSPSEQIIAELYATRV